MRNQKGFTLIELVVVIAILGILAAFALPRFANLTSQARVATINGLVGSLRSAAAIAHAQQLADGTSGSTSVTLDGTVITMVGGYPTPDANGIEKAAQISGFTGTSSGATATDTDKLDFTTAVANCFATYTGNGTATSTTSGC